ncbi:hypothetical protein ACVMGC_007937 [Bradyrhizobium barranii subsp. barranii]|uniref:hypothetical protein n=1 Tax=Bradyrhizobium TaxID=374 RepID=UPI0004239DE2|nr:MULTISPECIES: hypothetical protein [Bradyrhizobium]MBR0877768.1 hypothetical protein [Bradyrhizobium liaoningense]MBR0997733.1 hypothetical protein [Bradyrhizobium liaoningense]MBR1066465.1 hypothetical protein [Bradyrhizobium liaoningense]MCP1743596.1 hypothetical protein [Bradyrhizobium japonicum]MCP1781946.1 hypothetical protein [Bradyrhizobium japonicum]
MKINVALPDTYVLRARLIPAVVAGAPAFALAAILVSWSSFNFTQFIAAMGLAALFSVFSNVARTRGKAIEPGIYEKMGGMPSTIILRHNDSTFDPVTKARMHAFLAKKLNEPAPTAEQEATDPVAADGFYARGGNWLRENTRDTKKFPLVFGENINYGFHRNLLGLRLPGFCLNALIVIFCAVILYLRYPIDISRRPDQALVTVIGVAVLHALYLAFFVNEHNVFQAARLYARQLLLSIEKLNKPAAAPAVSRSRTRKQN